MTTHPPVRLPKFALISGIGWMLDIGVTLGLVAAGSDVMVANMIGAGLAVSFVFIAAQRHVFFAEDRSLVGFFAVYLVWQVMAITAASFAIDQLAAFLSSCGAGAFAQRACGLLGDPTLAAGIAKVAVTPITMYLNFLFMGWLSEARISWR